MNAAAHRPTWKTLLAFAIIYFVWGSTYLAIRIGVQEVPPFLLAGMRFTAAGVILFGWVLARRERLPSAREWASAVLIAIPFFAIDYGLVFWAEQRVPSGLTAVMMATIPSFIAISEIVFLRTQRPTMRAALALLAGIAGVALLVSRSVNLGGVPIDRMGAVAILFAAASWSVATVIARKMRLPSSPVVSSAAQMLAGGLQLLVAAAVLGEFRGFRAAAVPRGAWFALVYLIVAGSIVAFTAYVWLIHHESPTKVGTYAYVNPVVAVLLGYFIAGEPLGLRTVFGTLLILLSVVVITTMRAAKPVPLAAPAAEEQPST